jgi:hypothetical protein
VLAGYILRTIRGYEQHFMPKRMAEGPKPSLRIGDISLWETVRGDLGDASGRMVFRGSRGA